MRKKSLSSCGQIKLLKFLGHIENVPNFTMFGVGFKSVQQVRPALLCWAPWNVDYIEIKVAIVLNILYFLAELLRIIKAVCKWNIWVAVYVCEKIQVAGLNQYAFCLNTISLLHKYLWQYILKRIHQYFYN